MPDTATVHILSAGAAQALVRAQLEQLRADTGARGEGRFGAVGAIKEAFDAGLPCDLIVLTAAQIAAMEATGQVRPGSARPLGRVLTGVAVRRGDARPDVATPDSLRAALLAADGIYLPDPLRATAGIHFAKVLHELGIHEQVAARLQAFPNGAAAMQALGETRSPQPIGCTQVTEILYTPGVDLVAKLPPAFELGTVYTAAVADRAARPDLAEQLMALIAGPASAALRQRSGFEA